MHVVELQSQSQATKTPTTELTTFEGRTREWQKIIKRFEKWERKLKALVVRLFREQERVTLKRFFRAYGRKSELRVSEPIFDPTEWVEKWRNEFEPFISQVVLDAARRYARNPQLGHPAVRAAIGERTRIFSELPNQTTAKKIQQVLRRGFEEGKPIPDIADDIRAVFKDATARRAQLIARTEVMGASNFGVYLGALDGGFPFKMWLTSRDERVRESHRIDGQVKKTEEPFQLRDGRRMMFPQDFNERCTIRPLMENPYGDEQTSDVQTIDFGLNTEELGVIGGEKFEKAAELLRKYYYENRVNKEYWGALDNYKGAEYARMNNYLRGHYIEIPAKVKKHVEKLKELFESGAAPELEENLTVYRGLKMDFDFNYLGIHTDTWEHNLELVRKRLIGHELEESAFVSTTLDSSFAAEWVKQEPVNIVLRIRVPARTRVVSLDLPDDVPGELALGEGEILLKHNTKYKVLDITKEVVGSNEVVLVDLEVLP